MANPNIIGTTDIRGTTSFLKLTTSNTAIVQNSTANSVCKINSLMVTNIDGANSVLFTGFVHRLPTSNVHFGFNINIPPQTSLVVLTKDASVYLQENDTIYLRSSAPSGLDAMCSYEVII